MAQVLTSEELNQAVTQGAVLITANQRLSRRLTQEYAQQQRAQGAGCWPTPKILPWSAWLLNLWDDVLLTSTHGDTAKIVLNPQQTHLLWEKIIRRSRLDKGILNIQATAAGVAQAWTLLQAWTLPLPALSEYPNEDAAAFRIWALDFQRECERRQLLDSARLPNLLADLARQSRLTLPERVLLIGFDEFNPQQKILLTVLEEQGCAVEPVKLPEHPPKSTRVTCGDAEDELARAAGWAGAHLSANAKARIAVVVPDLHARRAQVERVFSDVLHPQHILPRSPREQRCFNISLGQALSESPMIRAALNILRLAQGRIDAHQLGSLLRSPYTRAGESEAAGRAQLDLRLRERGDYEVWLADLLGMARRPLASHEERVLAPQFLLQLEKLFVYHRSITGKYFHHQWAERFTACLRNMGWPGERGLNRDEQQQLQSWQELLDNFASLDVVGEAINVSQALSRLNHIASEQLFQARTAWRPVQILGLLEASGQRFDHLWVCGMDDESWPSSPRPNPWLPLKMQRSHGLPHADAERELMYAQGMTRQLQSTAAESVFSHARWDGDRARRPSPLITAMPDAPPEKLAAADIHLFRDLTFAYQDLETLEDNVAPVVPTGRVGGGSGLIASQAACPFQAFGRYRLGARELEEVTIGPDARQRGLLLHQAMQLLWTAITGSAELARLSDEALTKLVKGAIDPVLEQARLQKPRTYTPRFVEVEKRVLSALIIEWLQCEREREGFTVAAREEAVAVMLAGLELRVVLDRIDRTSAGEQIILDYKTGRVSAGGWDDERPESPQLPMYALALENPPAAVSFAQIRPGSTRFVGCGSEDANLPGVKTQTAAEWAQRVQDWQLTLSAIAAEFKSGAAAVTPKNAPQTCRYCDLTSICRVHELDVTATYQDEQDT